MKSGQVAIYFYGSEDFRQELLRLPIQLTEKLEEGRTALLEWAFPEPWDELHRLEQRGTRVLCCLPSQSEIPPQLLQETAVARFFLEPLDWDEIAHELGVMTNRRLNELTERLWRKGQAQILEKLHSLGGPSRSEARSAAHQLAGTLGSFGLQRASEVASQLDIRLSNPDGDAAAHQEETRLRGELEALVAAGPEREVPEPEEWHWGEGQCEFKVLVVDDDPTAVSLLRRSLECRRIQIFSIDDPLEFWMRRKELQFDLLILDLDMPRLSGYELCRALRRDASFHELAILVLTARGDGETVTRLYRAGADDFVTKPFVGPELRQRVQARLERFRLLRALIESDSLTGLVHRRHADELLERSLQRALRDRVPLVLAQLEIDGFAQLAEDLGHSLAEQILVRVAEMMRRHFRGQDLVFRWEKQQFLVCLQGAGAGVALWRLGELLEELQSRPLAEEFSMCVSFSAGVAPVSFQAGSERSPLQEALDRSAALLQQALQGGGNRIQAEPCRVAMSSDDYATTTRWTRTLARYSYQLVSPDDPPQTDICLWDQGKRGPQPQGVRILPLTSESRVTEVLAALARERRREPG